MGAPHSILLISDSSLASQLLNVDFTFMKTSKRNLVTADGTVTLKSHLKRTCYIKGRLVKHVRVLMNVKQNVSDCAPSSASPREKWGVFFF